VCLLSLNLRSGFVKISRDLAGRTLDAGAVSKDSSRVANPGGILTECLHQSFALMTERLAIVDQTFTSVRLCIENLRRY
jgi:hypothetical protein